MKNIRNLFIHSSNYFPIDCFRDSKSWSIVSSFSWRL